MAQDATIRSIFYARFHDDFGPRVLHQVPEGSIIPCLPSPTAMKVPLFDFQSIRSYLIPNREFCGRPVSVCSNGYRILGHPICVSNPDRYERNDFIFNLCIVIDDSTEATAIKRVVTKIARLFRILEEQDRFLSKEETTNVVLTAGTEGYGGEKGSKVFAAVEIIFEDLRAVGETMIPIDESNTIFLSLFPARPAPPAIHDYHVPLSIVRFTSLHTAAWDLTVQRIIPFIDGINSVSQIAKLADSDAALTRRAIQHLVYYDCVLLLDIFTFSAVYTPTPLIKDFISDTAMQDECRRYVFSSASIFGKTRAELEAAAAITAAKDDPPPLVFQKISPRAIGEHHQEGRSSGDSNPAAGRETPSPQSYPSQMTLINLYTALRQSLPLRDFCLANAADLRDIDIRRLITFGVIKGFLYRAHRYAVIPPKANAALTQDTKGSSTMGSTSEGRDESPDSFKRRLASKREHHPTAGERSTDPEWRLAASSSGWRQPDKKASNRRRPASPPLAGTTPTQASTLLAAAQSRITAKTNTTSTSDQPTTHPPPLSNGGSFSLEDVLGAEDDQQEGEKAAITDSSTESSDAADNPARKDVSRPDRKDSDERRRRNRGRRAEPDNGRDMLRWADGSTCLDAICTAVKKPEDRVVRALKDAAGDGVVVFLYK